MTDPTADCIHGLMTMTCTTCNGRDARERAAERERPRTFPAKYAGQCRACDLPIHVGQVIAWRPDEAPTHEECAA